jgi:hypothetical protein
MANRTKRTAKKARQFVESLLQTGGNVSRACLAVNIGRMTAYEWRNDDPEFAKAWDEAVEAGLDDLEQEARRRAFEGVLEPHFYQGVECGYVRKYSDTLLIFLLKGGRPEKYKDRVEQDHKGIPANVTPTVNIIVGDGISVKPNTTPEAIHGPSESGD